MEQNTIIIIVVVIVIMCLFIGISYSYSLFGLNPKDCKYTWNEWSACNKSTGKQTRTINIINDKKGNGSACPALESKDCKVDCEYNWNNWSTCGMSSEKKTRTSNISVNPLNGGNICPIKEEQYCIELYNTLDFMSSNSFDKTSEAYKQYIYNKILEQSPDIIKKFYGCPNTNQYSNMLFILSLMTSIYIYYYDNPNFTMTYDKKYEIASIQMLLTLLFTTLGATPDTSNNINLYKNIRFNASAKTIIYNTNNMVISLNDYVDSIFDNIRSFVVDYKQKNNAEYIKIYNWLFNGGQQSGCNPNCCKLPTFENIANSFRNS